jgi:hypothetical protein
MANNLLAIIQAAALELGLLSPVSVVGNPDGQTQQMLALANREGRELAQIEGGWTALRAEQDFVMVPGQSAYPFPTDFAYYLADTMWDRSTQMPMSGPMSSVDWQILKSGIFPAGVFIRYRIMNGMIYFNPMPASADNVAIEYISSNWCQSVAGVPQGAFLADTDIPLLPDDLFTLGIKWRFLAVKGFNYSEEKDAYELSLSRLRPRDKVTEDINMGSRGDGAFLNMGILPFGNWPGRSSF